MATTADRIRSTYGSRRETLEKLLGQQFAVLQNRKHVLRDGPPTPASGVLDAEEHSGNAEEQGVGLAVFALTVDTVREIETALRRLTAGEFGTCPDCRCSIPPARLRALPFAALCLACQQRQEAAGDAWTRVTSRWQ